MFDESINSDEVSTVEDNKNEKPCLRIGCTGHRNLSRIVGFDEKRSREAIRAYFEQKCNDYSVKLYCGLADGADTLFAEEALSCGVQLVAVLPCPWREYATEHADGGRFITLLNQASEVIIVPDNVQRYVGVLRCILENGDEIIALWDGAAIPLFDEAGNQINRGGTYDMLVSAKMQGKEVKLFN